MKKSMLAAMVAALLIPLASLAAQSDVKPDAGSADAMVISGGVGLDARDRLLQQGQRYPLKLVFALNSGEYLSDARVQITRAGGQTIVDEQSQGPWMFVNLPPGTYTVSATVNDRRVSRKVAIGKGAQKVVQLRWSDAVAERPVAARADREQISGSARSAATTR